MRPIKFRAWAFASKNMFYPDTEDGWDISMGLINPLPNTCIMQYTGLKDKNSVEIYEGEFVRKDSYSQGYFLEIVWRDCMFQLGHDGISPLYNSDGYEVIGNIHQNPELIKKKRNEYS